jgi:hypothetical protein
MLFGTPRFRRRPGDRVLASLTDEEVGLFRSLPGELRSLLEGSPDDEAYQRIFPRAYVDPTEEQSEADWQAMVHSELLEERLAAVELVATSVERGTPRRGRVEIELSPDEVAAWLGVLNDARLTLGTRLQVTEDANEMDPSDPRAPAFALYHWLTWVQSDLVEVLLAS